PLLVRVEEVPQAAPPRLRLELLDDRRVEVRVAGLAHLLLVDGLGGIDVLVHERGEALLVVLAAVGQLEVHAFSSWWVAWKGRAARRRAGRSARRARTACAPHRDAARRRSR